MTAVIMSVDEYEEDRERELVEAAGHLDCTIQKVQTSTAPGTIFCHESVQMSALLYKLVRTELCGHPAIISRRAWYIKARQIEDLLHSLYDDIAEEHLYARQ